MTLLDGKATLILGASQGIGAAAARFFAAQGARLVLASRNLSALEPLRDELRELGSSVECLRTDVTKRSDVDAAVALTVDTYGRLDAAFNNAGSTSLAPFHEISEREWDRVVAVNLTGVFLAMQAEIRAMLATGGGAIVNTSSVGGLVANYGVAPYVASKHGVIGLTKAAAYEYGEQNIRINAIAPAATATEMLLEGVYNAPPEIRARFNTTNSMNRMAAPGEIGPAAAWLLSDRASFVHGVTLPVDGGFTAR